MKETFLDLKSDNIRDNKPNKTRFAFTILAIVQATLIFTIALIIVPLPKIASEFALSSANLLLVQVAYGLPFSGLLLFGGRLADRYRGRLMFVIGLIIFGGASVIAAFAPNFEMLVSMRFIQGIGAALTAPAALAVLRTLFPDPAAFGKAMAIWGGVPFLGAIIGFVIPGILTNWISWRWMFVFPIVVAIVALTLTRKLLPIGYDNTSVKQLGLDPVGAVLVTLGISLASYGLIASGDYPWTSTTVYGPLAVGIVLLVAFLLVERKVRDPLLPPGFVIEPRRITGLLGIFLAAAGSMLIEYILTLYLQQIRGWSSLETAVSFLPFLITMIVANQVAASLVSRFGVARITTVGGVIAAIGLGILASINPNTVYVYSLLPGQIFLAMGISFVLSGAAVLSMTNVPQHQAGLAGGVLNTAMELGPTVGLTLLMSVAATQTDLVQGYAWAFGTAGAVYLVNAVVSSMLLRRRSSEKYQQT
ncbi:MFS transporter [Shimazuella kribbensis]|uniref:MFS transporter n=1 Tax=Shimazuella kribbensis TaxID=139808 RepID=UPI000416CD7A|nr:MFS transporter [Shimazuella kribbensis]